MTDGPGTPQPGSPCVAAAGDPASNAGGDLDWLLLEGPSAETQNRQEGVLLSEPGVLSLGLDCMLLDVKCH